MCMWVCVCVGGGGGGGRGRGDWLNQVLNPVALPAIFFKCWSPFREGDKNETDTILPLELFQLTLEILDRAGMGDITELHSPQPIHVHGILAQILNYGVGN